MDPGFDVNMVFSKKLVNFIGQYQELTNIKQFLVLFAGI
jgi:hypothetical protein